VQEYHVLNLGAGVQSTCLFLLAREPDAAAEFLSDANRDVSP